MKFFIKDITRRTGEIRTEAKYSNRIGSTIEFLNPVKIGEPAYFKYIKYNNGELVEDHRTQISRVDYLEWFKDNFYIYTHNSIYKLTPIDDTISEKAGEKS